MSLLRLYCVLALVLLGCLLLSLATRHEKAPDPTPPTPTPAPAGPATLEAECPAEFSIQGSVRGASGGTARVFANKNSAGDMLALDFAGGKATLTKIQGGKSTLLAEAPLPAADRFDFTLKRRSWRATLVLDGRVAARGYESELSGGKAGWETSGGARVQARLQATEPVTFDDDFTRSPGDATGWETLAGSFRANEIPIGVHHNLWDASVPDEKGRFSSNAFSWVGEAKATALCTAGYWFWDDYCAEASVKPETPGAIGIAAYVKDADNYLLFRWTAAAPGRPGSGEKEIVRVQGGKATVLAAKPGGFQTQQWYRLRFVACDGKLVGWVDGCPEVTAWDDTFGQGKVGLYARGCDRAVFDDVRVRGLESFRESFARAVPCKWEDAGIAWATDEKARRRLAGAAGEGVTVAGGPAWSRYTFAARVRPGGAKEVGLAFAYHDARNYSFFRVPAASSGRAEIVQVAEGKPAVLARSPASLSARGGAALRLDVDRECVRARVGSRVVATALSSQGFWGKAGFYARGGAGAAFDSVAVSFPFEEPAPVHVDAQFAKEETMEGWASARGSWLDDGSGFLWHAGSFFGDAEVSLPVPAERERFAATLVLDGDGQDADSGYRLRAVLVNGKASLALSRAGRPVATRSVAWRKGEESTLRFCRRGGLVAGRLGNGPWLSYSDARPLAGTCVGIGGDEPLDLEKVQVTTDGVLDTTFSGPPTDWWSARGVWDVAQRWPCDPRWSFFGGLQSESPMLWTKRSFQGDVTAEAWVALYMDNIQDVRVGYKHASDLNLSICADGKDPSSGYTFQFGARRNTVTRLLRKEQEVAANPSVVMINPIRSNLEFQRHWYYLRAEKRGRLIRFFVDDEPACQFEDPNPLPGGQVVLWSWKNGLMVARARVWYAKDGGRRSVPAPAVAPAPPSPAHWKVSRSPAVTLSCDFANGLNGWGPAPDEGPIVTVAPAGVPGGKALRVVNPISGGCFSVLCGAKRFDAGRFPTLRFDYRIPKGVKINLYLRCRGQWASVGLTAPEAQIPRVQALGTIPIIADGRWHAAAFDLGAKLAKALGGTHLPVEDLCFGSPDVEYLRSGFGGNHWGSEYGLANFRLVGTSATTAADAAAVEWRR